MTPIVPIPNPNHAGHKRRLGLLGAKRTTITVHRSEEVLPRDVGGHLVRQGTSVSSGEEGGGGGGGAASEGEFGEGSERYRNGFSLPSKARGEGNLARAHRERLKVGWTRFAVFLFGRSMKVEEEALFRFIAVDSPCCSLK